MRTDTTRTHPGVGGAVMAGFGVGFGTAVVAGHRSGTAAARAQVLGRAAKVQQQREFSDPVARSVRDARVQMLELEQAGPLRSASRNGRAAIAGALLAVGSLAGGIGFSATS